MAKCKLTIQLDNPSAQYLAGEKVSGQLLIDVSEPCQVDDLNIQLYWQTHGRGNKNKGAIDTLSLHKGTLGPGKHSYPFSFELKDEPISYSGKHVNIDWQLEARADVPWALDPKAEAAITVKANPSLKSSKPFNEEFECANTHPQGNKSILIAFALIMVGVSVFGLWSMISAFNAGDMFNVLFYTMPFIMPIYIAVKIGMPFLAAQKTGEVEIKFPAKNYQAGDIIDVEISITPQSKLDINSMSVRLVNAEYAVSGSGTSRSRHRHETTHATAELLGKVSLMNKITTKKTARLVLPANVMHSFASDDNGINWHIALDVDIPKWPDLAQQKNLVVV